VNIMAARHMTSRSWLLSQVPCSVTMWTNLILKLLALLGSATNYTGLYKVPLKKKGHRLLAQMLAVWLLNRV
jgi:hypothetical protein